MIDIKIKKLHVDAVIPKQGHSSDAGYDLVAISDPKVVFEDDFEKAIKYLNYIEYDTGLSVQPPEGYHTEIYPRSSISKMGLVLANSIGLIDRSYTGSLIIRFKPIMTITSQMVPLFTKFYKKGDKLAQLVIKKTEYANFVEVDNLEDTVRGDGGFGSTDKKV